jgi:hypothetical protein
MSETHSQRRTLRSIGAVLADMLVGIVLTLGTDELLHIAGVFPPWGQSMVGFDGTLLLATAYRVVYGVAGSYLIARLAPSQRMLHALVGGVFGVIVSAVRTVLRVSGDSYSIVCVTVVLPPCSIKTSVPTASPWYQAWSNFSVAITRSGTTISR